VLVEQFIQDGTWLAPQGSGWGQIRRWGQRRLPCNCTAVFL